MLGYEKKQKSLNREQKRAIGIGLLSIGTFLEYFDLMLYVHMAVLINELFFPQYDTHVNRLIVVTFSPSAFPAIPIFYKSFPVLKRFTYASFIYAYSRAAMYVISFF
ncbi:hypothetical protein O6R16_00930 [Candidatus Rickettsia tasmanensis]